MKAVALLILFAVVALASKQQFSHFTQKYNKRYASVAEYQKRYQIFEENMKRADELTAANNGSAQFGMTKFSDLSPEGFARFYLMPNFTRSTHTLPPAQPKKSKLFAPNPTNWDWFKQQGICTPIYNQGQCGSCWAFSATETIESGWALAGNKLTRFSMEQIVDCDTTDGGCNGGNTMTAYSYVTGAGGIEPYRVYPYTAGDGQSGECQFDSSSVVQGTGSFSANAVNGESGLYSYASQTGPVSVCVDASSWQNYQNGVLTDCGSNIDHCVQLTGYHGYNGNNPYWIVRNSWGTDWGLNGFIWIQIGQDLCAIGDSASVVTFGN